MARLWCCHYWRRSLHFNYTPRFSYPRLGKKQAHDGLYRTSLQRSIQNKLTNWDKIWPEEWRCEQKENNWEGKSSRGI